MGVNVAEVQPLERAAVGQGIRQIERGISYPLGEDRFSIDHGEDYFAFFDRLGGTTTFVATEDGEVVGCATGVLRTIPRDGVLTSAWYCCDLKVIPSHRGRRLPLRMLLAGLRRHYRRCQRGYGVAMRPSDGRKAPAIRLAEHISVIGLNVGPALHIFGLDAAQMRDCMEVVQEHRGELSFLSLRGRKDLLLHSTGHALPALHVQYGPCAEHTDERTVEPGHVYFFCVPDGDPLLGELARLGVHPSGHADILHHRMGGWDWQFVLTSDL